MSSGKNMAVVRLADTGEFKIESVFQLEGYNRSWLTSKDNWPQQATLFDDEGIQDRYCQILLIGTKIDCELYEKSLHQHSSAAHTGEMVYVYKEQYDELYNMVIDLKKQVYSLKQELTEIKNATCVNIYDQSSKHKVHLVGEYKIPVPVYRVIESSLIGFNAPGFWHLCESLLGSHIFQGKNWKAIEPENQTKIQDILRHFVLNNYMREENKPPAKPSVLAAKYKEIYDSFINMLNSRKYASKRKNTLADTDTKKKSKIDPLKEEHNSSSNSSLNHGEYNNHQVPNVPATEAEIAAQQEVDAMHLDANIFY